MPDDSADLSRIVTADGVVLEAEAWIPPAPAAAVVITHPHPTYGGSMHTPVPAALFSAGRALGVAVVRFNFRGVGRSTGAHDDGRAERLDVAAAVDALRGAVGPSVPLALAGWSFGADVALAIDAATLADAAVAGWMAVAAPLSVVPAAEMTASHAAAPKVLVVPEHDQFRPPHAAAEATAGWTATSIVVVPGADHFLTTGLDAVRDAFEAFVGTLTG